MQNMRLKFSFFFQLVTVQNGFIAWSPINRQNLEIYAIPTTFKLYL